MVLPLEVFKDILLLIVRNMEARNAFKHREQTTNLCDQSACDRELQIMCHRSKGSASYMFNNRIVHKTWRFRGIPATAGHGWVEGVGPTDPALQSVFKNLNVSGPSSSGGPLPNIPPKNQLKSVVGQTSIAVLKAGPSTSGSHLPNIPPKNQLKSVVSKTNIAVSKAGAPTRGKATRLKSVVAQKKTTATIKLLKPKIQKGLKIKIRDGCSDPKVQTSAVTTKTRESPLLDEGFHSDCEDAILPSVSTQSSRDDDSLKLQLENLRQKNTELLEKLAVALEQLEFLKLSSANN